MIETGFSIKRKNRKPIKGLGRFSLPYRMAVIFLAPAAIIYFIFVIIPLARVFKLSFYDWRGISAGSEKFIGIKNFVELFHDNIFWRALFNNFSLFILVIFLSVVIALFFAYMLANKIKGTGFYKATWLFPNMLGDIVVVTIWLFIFHPTMGMLNFFLDKIGINVGATAWLGQSSTALISVALPMIWKYMGLYIILFLAAIQEIPDSFVEAAKIDGASKTQVFFKIVLPLLKPTIAVAVVFMMFNSFSVIFTYIKFLTEGGPYRSTEVLPTYIYQVGFELHRFGYGSAISVVAFIFVSIIAVFVIRVLMSQIVRGEKGF
ncbi:MAG: sugar ABC transporter permease [Actinobacteria bacterium]|nr:sugar ABC transporter permease [Actinomycetota bacterium]